MNVFVIGAHGRVGHKITLKLAHRNYNVIAGMRTSTEFDSLPKSRRIKPVLFNVTRPVSDIERKFRNNHVNAVIFSAGAGGASLKLTMLVDLDGAVKTMQVAEKLGIKRYEMVSAAGSSNRKFWEHSSIRMYYLAKYYADIYLRNSGLNYTIFHPVALSDRIGTDKVTTNPKNFMDTAHVTISRSDVASAVALSLENDKSYHQEYTIANGDTPLKSIFNNY